MTCVSELPAGESKAKDDLIVQRNQNDIQVIRAQLGTIAEKAAHSALTPDMSAKVDMLSSKLADRSKRIQQIRGRSGSAPIDVESRIADLEAHLSNPDLRDSVPRDMDTTGLSEAAKARIQKIAPPAPAYTTEHPPAPPVAEIFEPISPMPVSEDLAQLRIDRHKAYEDARALEEAKHPPLAPEVIYAMEDLPEYVEGDLPAYGEPSTVKQLVPLTAEQKAGIFAPIDVKPLTETLDVGRQPITTGTVPAADPAGIKAMQDIALQSIPEEATYRSIPVHAKKAAPKKKKFTQEGPIDLETMHKELFRERLERAAGGKVKPAEFELTAAPELKPYTPLSERTRTLAGVEEPVSAAGQTAAQARAMSLMRRQTLRAQQEGQIAMRNAERRAAGQPAVTPDHTAYDVAVAKVGQHLGPQVPEPGFQPPQLTAATSAVSEPVPTDVAPQLTATSSATSEPVITAATGEAPPAAAPGGLTGITTTAPVGTTSAGRESLVRPPLTAQSGPSLQKDVPQDVPVPAPAPAQQLGTQYSVEGFGVPRQR